MNVALTAVFAVAKAELRTRWRSLTALGLLFGLMGGAVIATASITRRTGSAYARLVTATHRHDAAVLIPGDRPDLARKATALPGVAASWAPGAWTGRINGVPGLAYLGLVAGPDHPTDVLHPVLLQGRVPRDDAADEVLISEAMTQDFAVPVGLGSYLDLTLITAAQFARFDVGFGDPAGPPVRLRVVGIGRLPLWSDGFHAMASPAFATRYRSAVVGYLGLLRLHDGGSAMPAFAEGLDRLAKANPTPPEFAEFGPLQARYAAPDEEALVGPARRVLMASLTITTWLTGLATLLVIAQALARHHGVSVHNQRVEAALGLIRAERAMARTLPAVPGALLAAVVGAASGLATGYLQPLGTQRNLEPRPGYLPDAATAAVGAACLAVLFLLLAAATAAAALRRSRWEVAPSARSGRVPVGWLPPALRTGWCLAGSSGGRRDLATAATTLGLTAGIAVLVAAVSFGGSLDRLVMTPARYGWTSDLSITHATDDEIARLVADERVAALSVVTTGEARLGAEPVHVSAFDNRKGALGPAVVAGRLPAAVYEVAVGPRLASRHALALGDELVLTRPDGGASQLRVTGLAVVRLIGIGRRLGDDVIVHPDALIPLVGTPSIGDVDIRAIPGQAHAIAADLRHLEVGEAEPPPEITILADIRLLPYVVAAIAGGGAAAGLLHALYVARRRHRREFAILRAIGFTRRQLDTTRTVTALALVLPAVVVGLPIGLGAGRLVWYEVATASGAGGDALLPGWLIAIAAMALLAASIAVAARRPGLSDPVAASLRTE